MFFTSDFKLMPNQCQYENEKAIWVCHNAACNGKNPKRKGYPVSQHYKCDECTRLGSNTGKRPDPDEELADQAQKD